ncbi:hypothetical protein LM599_05305 [Candidatus Acetothermia bacterium]|nr:hypothetical protein [Candidatus Acetothermia bacterium]
MGIGKSSWFIVQSQHPSLRGAVASRSPERSEGDEAIPFVEERWLVAGGWFLTPDS